MDPATATSIFVNLDSIPILNGTNFKDWKENILLILGCMDLDLALRTDHPPSLTDTSSSEMQSHFEKWKRSNCISLMIIKRSMPENFRGAISEGITNAKDFLAEIEKYFVKSDKAETSMLLQRLISMKYNGKGNIRKYIMEMSHIATKLKNLKLELSEDLLIHLVLISLPKQYNQFKARYNYQERKWTLNELISYLVHEEEMLTHDSTKSANVGSTSKAKGKKRKAHGVAKISA